MSEELLIAVLNVITKFGFDAAIEVMNMKNAKTIDEAIAALEQAKTKTAAQYLAEAK